ncbi:MAG: YsnF/AvaK domain-containing protein [Chitinophagaceae bacterium]|nr:YsnF/AvaK domain-containing protein [Oligoflexus sp.]
MQNKPSATVIAVFEDFTNAKNVVQELKRLNLGDSIRLVENDLSASDSFNGSQRPPVIHEKQGGVAGFFARLFGTDDQDEVQLNNESEEYFRESYQNRHHLVVVDGCTDLLRCREIMLAQGGKIEERGGHLYESERLKMGGEDQASSVMQLSDEQLKIQKEKVQTGEVRMRKETVVESQTFTVPVTREELVIETRTLNGAARPGSLDESEFGETREIRIPVSEEQVHIEKQVVAREEVRVSREERVEDKKITENLKHEELRLEEEGRVSLKGKDAGKFKPSPKAKTPDQFQPGV